MTPDRDKKDQELRWQRERMATAAMAAIVTRRPENDHFAHITAKLAVDYADALIEELNKEQ